MRWRSPIQSLARALVGVAVFGGAAVGGRAGQSADCRDEACAPHCPVRPGEFGYHPTQWRRWPGDGPPAGQPRDDSTPAAPPRSLVPGVDEESPRKPADATPTAAVPRASPPAAGDEGAATAAGGRRLERLVGEADAARLADAASRQAFTSRLVTAMLSEPDPQVRCGYLALAAGFDTPAAEAICAGALEDPDPRVRLAACRACAERRGPECVARLVRRACDDADLGVRLRAVRSLGELGDEAAIPPLVALLDDPDPAVVSRATAALARSTGRNFGADVARWKQWAAAPDAAESPRWSLGSALRSLF